MMPRLRAAALVGMGLLAWGCLHADALLEINVLAPAPPGARIDDLTIDVTDAGVHKTYGIPPVDGGLSSTVPLKLGIHVPLSAAGTFTVVVSGFDRSSGCKTAEGMASAYLDSGAITRDVVVQMERIGDGGCSDGGATGGAFGGTGGASGGGGHGAGGTTGAGGGSGLAGNSGAGGGTGIGGITGGGGAPGLGGNSGVGGTPGTGGRVGAGGSSGMGGRVGAGGAGTGGAPGVGGTTGLGGMGMGGAGTGGAPGVGGTTGLGGRGMGGSGTGGAMVTVDAIAGLPNTFGDQLKDSFILLPCYAVLAQDCTLIPTGACPVADPTKPFEDQGLVTKETFTLGGTVGGSYTLTIRVNGITEGKVYTGGIRSAGNADPPNPDAPAGLDTFYIGGAPVDLQSYKVYKLIVLNPNGTEVQHYYLNSMPTSAFENHNTFPIGYTHDILVPGGGSIVYQTASRNCRAIDNCGAGFRAVSCLVADGRNVPNEPGLQVPTMYMGQSVASMNARNGAAQPFHAQILHITVTAAAAAVP